MHHQRSLRVRAAIVSAVLACAATAWAQKPKYSRSSDVKINVKISDRVKPIDPNAEKPAAKQPSVSADQILNIEGLVGEIREEQAALLFDLIKNTPDSEAEEKADLYFRLGELFAKQQRFYRLKAAEYAIAADTETKSSAKASAKAKSEDSAKKSKKALVDAVKIYKALTDNEAFRNYPQMDKALFYYGFTLQGGTYMKEARSVYDKLLKNYPNSKYVPEAHLAFADYHFENNQLADAEDRYRKVLKYPKSNAYWYAMYKLGWIDLNLSRYKDALEAFLKVAEGTKNDKKQDILNKAAKKDFVRAYAEIGKAELAYQAFQRVDRKYAFTMLTMLGDRYLEQGKSEKAIYIFQELIKTAPKDKNVCLWQYNIAHSMLTVSGDDDKVKEIEKLTRMWGVLRDRKVLPKAEAEECHDNAAAMSGELARAYHSESVRTKNPTTLAYADKLYHVYLEVFQDAADYAETQYYYAELLWTRAENEKNPRLQTELFENSAIAFTDVVKLGKVSPELIKTAAYAAVLSWKNALNVDPRVKDTPVDDDKEYDKVPAKLPIPEREQKMLAAFDIYINYVKDPKDDELVGMKFLKANIYRRYNDFDSALPIFEEILEKHRDHETAEYAANLLLDSYNRLKRYDDMLAVATKLDNDKKFLEGKDKLRETISGLRITYERKVAESCEEKAKQSGDLSGFVECAEAYIKIFNRDTNAKDADVLLYNAGVMFEQGKSIGAAISMFSKLAKLYPDSKQTARALAKLGNNFGAVAYYDKAADAYEEYASKYAGEKDAFDAMSSAVFYRKGIGDDGKAIEDTKFFIKTFGSKNPDKAADAFFSLTTVYEKDRDSKNRTRERRKYEDANAQVIKHLRQYISQYGKKGGADRLITAHSKIGLALWEQSCPGTTVDGSCVRVTRERAVAGKRDKRRKGSSQPTQCGPESKIKLVTVNRDERMVKDAMSAFSKAVAEYERANGKTGGNEGGARYFYAQAKFYQAEKDYEEYLALRFPRGLDFDPKNPGIVKRSRKRFDEWYEAKSKTGGSARSKYEATIGTKDAASAIAAAARIGQIQQNFSDALFTAEIPESVRTGQFADEKVEAFCDALTEKAEPLAAKSLEAYGACLSKSTELGWFSDWSRLCERELGQIEPDKYPTAAELRDTPDEIAPITDIERPAFKLE
ncbi:MAG: tetratricopeptide repeat protein [Myxococcales bacterium]|nr:tetratricopeptide repeat protein [Myxococcales bacterium]